MLLKKILDSAAVASGVLTVFIVQNSELIKYQSTLLGVLIILSAIYLSLKGRSGSQEKKLMGNPIMIFLIISVVVFIVALTGGLSSPLYFLLYFIFFFLAFMSSSITIWVFLISLIIFFFPQALIELSQDTFIRLGSLLLIAPIAYFVCTEFERRGILKKRITSKSNEIINDANNLKETTKDPDEIEILDDIIDEASTLKKEVND